MEKGFETKYVSPYESLEDEGTPERRVDILVDGEKVGSAILDYYSKPLRLYQITDLYVDFEHQGKGYASKVMDHVEQFLKERKRPGVLVDAVLEGDPAQGMYARRGWEEVPGSHGLHVFNWPKDISLDVLKGYESRYTDMLERNKS